MRVTSPRKLPLSTPRARSLCACKQLMLQTRSDQQVTVTHLEMMFKCQLEHKKGKRLIICANACVTGTGVQHFTVSDSKSVTSRLKTYSSVWLAFTHNTLKGKRLNWTKLPNTNNNVMLF